MTSSIAVPEGYGPLALVLEDALKQAAEGKGRDRHAASGPGARAGHTPPFMDQPMMAITRMVGLGFPLGQAQKKAQEAALMAARGQAEAATAEILGAIVFLAGAVLALEDGVTP